MFYFFLQEMKAQLYAAVEQSPSAELVDPEVLTRYFAKFDEQFFHFCDSELAKINTFYSGKHGLTFFMHCVGVGIYMNYT